MPLLASVPCIHVMATQRPCLTRQFPYIRLSSPDYGPRFQVQHLKTLELLPFWSAVELVFFSSSRKVDDRLPGTGNSNSHGARPVHLIIMLIKWIRTSRLSIKNSLSLELNTLLPKPKHQRPLHEISHPRQHHGPCISTQILKPILLYFSEAGTPEP